MKNKIILAFIIFISIGVIPKNVEALNSSARSGVFIDIEKARKGEDLSRRILQGHTTENVNLRSAPNTNSEIIQTFPFNSSVLYIPCKNGWSSVAWNGKLFWMKSEYISKQSCVFTDYDVPENSGFKSYMPYQAITSANSYQKKLQDKYAYDGDYGIRMCKGRYLVALGTHFNVKVGQYVDLELSNKEVIRTIIGDIKDNNHTDATNIFTIGNGCMSEFIVNESKLPDVVKNNENTGTGTISSSKEEWDSPVVKVRAYDKYVFSQEEIIE